MELEEAEAVGGAVRGEQERRESDGLLEGRESGVVVGQKMISVGSPQQLETENGGGLDQILGMQAGYACEPLRS